MGLAKLAMGDGREHVTRDEMTVVAVGDNKLGAAVLLEEADASADLFRLGDTITRLHDLQPASQLRFDGKRLRSMNDIY